MRTLFLGLLIAGLACAGVAPAQDKTEPAKEKEKAVKLEFADFPPDGEVFTEEDLARRFKACKDKYDGKLVRVGAILVKKPDEKQKVPTYTLRVTGFTLVGKKPIPGHVDVDFVTEKPAPELDQKSRSGLIVSVEGRATFEPSGRLLIKDARVLGTSIPPGG